jgi:Homeodomain-like domain
MTQATKALIIEDWLRGLSRDRIAAKHGLSTGTVTNIIREWSAGLEDGVADELREFALALRKLGITAPGSAVGARVAYMMSKLGLDEDAFYSFMSETYDRCIKLGLQPERLSHDLKLLTDLSESVPWDQIPAHIEEQIARKEKLEQEIQTLESVASEAKTRLDMALEQEAVTVKVLNEYSDFRTEMSKNRIPSADLPAFVKTIKGIQELGYDANSIVSRISNLESLEAEHNKLKESVESLASKKWELEIDCRHLDDLTSTQTQALATYGQLESVGIGLKELKLFHNSVKEIAVANHIHEKDAYNKFYADVAQRRRVWPWM